MDEWEGAAATAKAFGCPIVHAISAVRRACVAQQVDELIAASQRLIDRAIGISSSLHDQVQKRHLLLTVMRGEWPAMAVRTTEARRRLRPLAVDLNDVLAAPRATMAPIVVAQPDFRLVIKSPAATKRAIVISRSNI